MIFLQLIKSLIILTVIPKCFSQDDDVYYTAEFTDEVRDCEGFDNEVFTCDSLKIGFIEGKEGNEGSLGLSGQLEVRKDIVDDYVVDLLVWKETDLTKEFMYAVSGNICDNLHKEDTPWWPLLKAFNSTECPIPQDVYPVTDLVLSLDFAKKVLRHEFVGDYEIQLSILDEREQQLSCHVISAGISERTKE